METFNMWKWLTNFFTAKDALLVNTPEVDYEVTTGRVANTIVTASTSIPVSTVNERIVPKVYNPKSYDDTAYTPRTVPPKASMPYGLPLSSQIPRPAPPAPVKQPPKPVYDYAADKARKAKEAQARDDEERARRRRRDEDNATAAAAAIVVASSWSSSSDSSSSYSSSSDSSSSYSGGDSGGGGSDSSF